MMACMYCICIYVFSGYICVHIETPRMASLNLKIAVINSFIHFGYFYYASSSLRLLRGTTDYSIDTESELTRRSAAGNYE